jgi:HK97 family phage major capsid protein
MAELNVTELIQGEFNKQNAVLDEIKASRTAYEGQIETLKTKNNELTTVVEGQKARIDDLETKMNRSGAGATITRDEADRPFESFGEQLVAIAKAADNPSNVDKRLVAINTKAASGGSALVGTDGAFLIQGDFSSNIFRIMNETDSLYSACDKHQCSSDSDSFSVPYIDETSRATGSRWGGVQVYRAGETDDVTAKKPKINVMKTELSDLRGLAYMTDRLLRDARAMSSIYSQAFAEEFDWILCEEIIDGAGANECLGILNSSALVTISKEVGQSADTVVFENVLKMHARLHSRSMSKAKWYVNQDVLPQLPQMNVGLGTSGALVFMPPGGVSSAPYGTLLGRPIQVIEQAKTVGDLGDIFLADFSQYQLIEKGGLQAASSIHVRFINHEQTFRWNWSINGQPKWKTALTPANGTNTVSPFIALAARA